MSGPSVSVKDPPLVIALCGILLLVGQASVEQPCVCYLWREGRGLLHNLAADIPPRNCAWSEVFLARLTLEMWGSQTGVLKGDRVKLVPSG